MTKNDMRGALFVNKSDGENHPDFKGDVKINGVNYWLAGWKTKGADGTYIALKAEAIKKADVDDDILM